MKTQRLRGQYRMTKTSQLEKIRDFMLRDTGWCTLCSLSGALEIGEACVSAQLRHLRKAKYTVEKKWDGIQWNYRLLPPQSGPSETL
jgi:hypothetical protein